MDMPNRQLVIRDWSLAERLRYTDLGILTSKVSA